MGCKTIYPEESFRIVFQKLHYSRGEKANFLLASIVLQLMQYVIPRDFLQQHSQ